MLLLALFRFDPAKEPGASMALWVPVIWIFIIVITFLNSASHDDIILIAVVGGQNGDISAGLSFGGSPYIRRGKKYFVIIA